jgi:hypothetical protein
MQREVEKEKYKDLDCASKKKQKQPGSYFDKGCFLS